MQAFCEFFNLKFVRAQCIVCHVASLAQLVEHLICNQRVVGSSPTTGTRFSPPGGGDLFMIYISTENINIPTRPNCVLNR